MMSFLRCFLRTVLLGAAAVLVFWPAAAHAQSAKSQTYPPELVARGHQLFEQNCAFCHGRDASGGETGPDLTASKVVHADVNGDKIGVVVGGARVDKGMPKFSFSKEQLSEIVAFLHTQASKPIGGRRGVVTSDLQTGNAAAGKAYFNGAGGCSGCHSATGDLAGIASRVQGLRLEMQMLYPRGAKAKVTVTDRTGKTYSGTLAHLDDFTVALHDADGWYHSWPVSAVTYKVDNPAQAHADQLARYTDDDIHNLMAYLQTLK